MKQPERENIPVPRLSRAIKDMNGKSTKRLNECIEALSDLLDDEEVQHEETTDEHRPLGDTGTE